MNHMRERQQTGIRKGDDGRFQVWCRICPKRQSKCTRRDERANVWFDTAEEALAQGKRHRQSEYHQQVVIAKASTRPTQEEMALRRIFGKDDVEPCRKCRYYHSQSLTCVAAAKIRDQELLD